MADRDSVLVITGMPEKLRRIDVTGSMGKDRMHGALDRHLGEAFPGLTRVAGKTTVKGISRSLTMDALAFDAAKRCFVAVHYRTYHSGQAMASARDFRREASKNGPALSRLHKSLVGLYDYDWNASYSLVIMTPSMVEKTASGISDPGDGSLSIYCLKMYDFVARLERVMGPEPGGPVPEAPPDPGPYKLQFLQERLERMIMSVGSLTRHEIRSAQSSRIAFKGSRGMNVCVVYPQKKRLKLYYSVRASEDLLVADRILVNHDKMNCQGGDFWTEITSDEDIERAARPLATAYQYYEKKPAFKGGTGRSARVNTQDVGLLAESLDSMISGIPGLHKTEHEGYTTYRLTKNNTVCALKRREHHVDVYYGAKAEWGILEEDGFVRADFSGGPYAFADYRSEIRSSADLGRVRPLLVSIRDRRGF